jgi:hypothetical protein
MRSVGEVTLINGLGLAVVGPPVILIAGEDATLAGSALVLGSLLAALGWALRRLEDGPRTSKRGPSQPVASSCAAAPSNECAWRRERQIDG